MHPTRLFAAAVFGPLAAHPGPHLDAQSDPDRTVAGGGRDVFRAPAALDVQGLVGYRVNHNLDVPLGALGVHQQ